MIKIISLRGLLGETENNGGTNMSYLQNQTGTNNKKNACIYLNLKRIASQEKRL